MLTLLVAQRRDARHLKEVSALVHTLATWSSTQKVVSLSSAESKCYSMVRCGSEAIGLACTIRESLDTKLKCESGQMLQRHADRLSEAGAAHQKETTELRIEKIRGTAIPQT